MLPFVGPEHGLGVFGDLLGRFKILVVHPIVLVLAVLGRIFAADLRARGVNPAAVVRLQVLALRVDEQVPRAVFDEHGRVIVQQKPADVLERLQTRSARRSAAQNNGNIWPEQCSHSTTPGGISSRRGFGSEHGKLGKATIDMIAQSGR